ncbi:anthrone oxygenase family protein [Dactylosporangium salmoneum]|uniref:DUF1772 domain-containing protein n=1 Tax=Dactylosporangium salmoneum TaxID=53361 RepID=A0ABN3FDD0_9ACTN
MLAAACVVVLGLLAGEELIVRWGVQPALAALDDRAHLQARIALVRRLKVVVPILIVPAAILTSAHVVTSPGSWPGGVALLAFVLLSAFGTVPINIRINDWDADHPPPDWRRVVHRWTVIDVFRSSAAVLAFVLVVAV